jgi:hypothetical protein
LRRPPQQQYGGYQSPSPQPPYAGGYQQSPSPQPPYNGGYQQGPPPQQYGYQQVRCRADHARDDPAR